MAKEYLALRSLIMHDSFIFDAIICHLLQAGTLIHLHRHCLLVSSVFQWLNLPTISSWYLRSSTPLQHSISHRYSFFLSHPLVSTSLTDLSLHLKSTIFNPCKVCSQAYLPLISTYTSCSGPNLPRRTHSAQHRISSLGSGRHLPTATPQLSPGPLLHRKTPQRRPSL